MLPGRQSFPHTPTHALPSRVVFPLSLVTNPSYRVASDMHVSVQKASCVPALCMQTSYSQLGGRALRHHLGRHGRHGQGGHALLLRRFVQTPAVLVFGHQVLVEAVALDKGAHTHGRCHG